MRNPTYWFKYFIIYKENPLKLKFLPIGLNVEYVRGAP